MLVKKIKVKSLTSEEWFGFIITFKKMLEDFGLNALAINDLTDQMFLLIHYADLHLEHARKSKYTEELKTGRHTIIRLTKDLFDQVASDSRHPDNAKKIIALEILPVLTVYHDKIVKGGYAIIKGTAYNMIDDMEKIYNTNIVELGLSEWVTALRSEYNAFTTNMELRNTEKSLRPPGSLTSIRNEVQKYYDFIINRIITNLSLAGYDKNPPANIIDDNSGDENPPSVGEHREHRDLGLPELSYKFAIEWNNVVKKYTALIASRQTRRINKKKEIEEKAKKEQKTKKVDSETQKNDETNNSANCDQA
jgi:hypothetical protein